MPVAERGPAPPIELLDREKCASLGIVALFFAGDEPGTLRDYVTGLMVSEAGAVGRGLDQPGPVWTFNGAQQQRMLFPLPLPPGASTTGSLTINSAGFAVMGRFKPTAAPAGNPGQFFGICASANSQASLGIGCDTSLNVGLAWLSGAGAGTICTVPGAANNWYTLYASAPVTGGASAWINGQPSNSQGTALSSGGAGLLDEIVFGAQHRASGYLRQANGNLEWGAIRYAPDLPMSDALALELYNADFPYNLFRDEEEPALQAAAGGGTTYTLTAGTGSFSLTGIAAGLKAGRALPAGTGSFALTGQAATLTYTRAGSTYTLTAGAGAFTLSGVAAGLKAGRNLPAGSGSFALTGNAAGLRRGFTLAAGAGSYSLTGVAASFSRTWRLAAGTGSFVLTGREATLRYDSIEIDILPDTALSGLWSLNTDLHARYRVNLTFDGRKPGR